MSSSNGATVNTKDTPGKHRESLNNDNTNVIPEGASEDNGGTSSTSGVGYSSGVSANLHRLRSAMTASTI